jgi:hypothetical protein
MQLNVTGDPETALLCCCKHTTSRASNDAVQGGDTAGNHALPHQTHQPGSCSCRLGSLKQRCPVWKCCEVAASAFCMLLMFLGPLALLPWLNDADAWYAL